MKVEEISLSISGANENACVKLKREKGNLHGSVVEGHIVHFGTCITAQTLKLGILSGYWVVGGILCVQSGYVHVIRTSPMLQVNAINATQNCKKKQLNKRQIKILGYETKKQKKKLCISCMYEQTIKNVKGENSKSILAMSIASKIDDKM